MLFLFIDWGKSTSIMIEYKEKALIFLPHFDLVHLLGVELLLFVITLLKFVKIIYVNLQSKLSAEF